jgi:hypothetical protein
MAMRNDDKGFLVLLVLGSLAMFGGGTTIWKMRTGEFCRDKPFSTPYVGRVGSEIRGEHELFPGSKFSRFIPKYSFILRTNQEKITFFATHNTSAIDAKVARGSEVRVNSYNQKYSDTCYELTSPNQIDILSARTNITDNQ